MTYVNGGGLPAEIALLYKLFPMKNNTTAIIDSDSKTWFRHWFDSSFYHQLYANRSESEASDFVDELIQELQPAIDSKMLDLGCGNGRHSRSLAAKGFDVTGIDLAASSIRYARNYETETLHFYRHDMRVPFGRNVFNYVFNFFTSFGYFDDSNEDRKVISNIYSALKPGGVLIMDYINSPYTETRLVPAEEKEIDGIIYHITRWSNDTHFYKKIRIESMDLEKPVENIEQVKKFSIGDFQALFESNGLELQQVYGDYHLNEYDVQNSPRLILIAGKK